MRKEEDAWKERRRKWREDLQKEEDKARREWVHSQSEGFIGLKRGSEA